MQARIRYGTYPLSGWHGHGAVGIIIDDSSCRASDGSYGRGGEGFGAGGGGGSGDGSGGGSGGGGTGAQGVVYVE
jgi:hypothetical protein